MRSRSEYNLKKTIALVTAVLTTDTNGATINRQGAEDVCLVAAVGQSADTLSGSVYILLEVEHSDNGSSWSDCADADLTASVTGATTGTFAKIDASNEDERCYSVGYIGGKQYVRVVINVVGTHTYGTPIGAVALLATDVVPGNA